MCHDVFEPTHDRDRAADADEEDEELPSFLAEEEPDEDLEVLTDGGDD